jgi:hypothetical protein
MDDRTVALVEQQIRRTGRSLLQYVGESSPWTVAEDQETLDRLRNLKAEEEEGIAALVRLLRRARLPAPYLGPYPEHFMTLNFLSLDRLLPLLVAEQRGAVADLESSLAQVWAAAALGPLAHLLEIKRRHLAALEELNKAHPKVGVRV